MKIVLATQNPGKISEIQALIPANIQVVTARECGIVEDIPETGDTLEINAIQKAEFLFKKTGLPSLADDTGLEVEHLNGAPGVYSARYAGEAKDNNANMDKLLLELKDVKNRKARFRTVLAWTTADGTKIFEGVIEGNIAQQRMVGSYGFGYDPVFIPNGHQRSFAQMLPSEKSSMSHRGRALDNWMRGGLNAH